MHWRLIITLFLCGWMAVSPMRIDAGENAVKPGLPLNKFPEMGASGAPLQPANLSPAQLRQLHPPVRTERTAAEWAAHRRQTARQRANAIAHVKRSRWIPNITYVQIQEIYDAKKAALDKVVTEGSYRRTLIKQTKMRVLAEVKAMMAVVRDRRAAEETALAAVEATLRAANPKYNEDALRKAMTGAQQQGGARVNDLEGLPVLPNATAMNYPEGGPDVLSKHSAVPTETPEEQAQLDALRDFKKKQALQNVKHSREAEKLKQQKLSHREVEIKLNALLDQFNSNKITTAEYYKQREIILKESGIK